MRLLRHFVPRNDRVSSYSSLTVFPFLCYTTSNVTIQGVEKPLRGFGSSMGRNSAVTFARVTPILSEGASHVKPEAIGNRFCSQRSKTKE